MLFSGVPVILAHLKLKKRMMKNKKLWIYTFLLVMLGCYDDPVEDLRNDASAEGTLTIEAAHELYREYMSRRRNYDAIHSPMNIYEMHMGSWRKRDDEMYPNYREVTTMPSAF